MPCNLTAHARSVRTSRPTGRRWSDEETQSNETWTKSRPCRRQGRRNAQSDTHDQPTMSRASRSQDGNCGRRAKHRLSRVAEDWIRMKAEFEREAAGVDPGRSPSPRV